MDSFDDFCKTNNIEDSTKETLVGNGIQSVENLVEVTENDLKEIGLNLGQRKSVMRGIKGNRSSMCISDSMIVKQIQSKINNLDITEGAYGGTKSKIIAKPQASDNWPWFLGNMKKMPLSEKLRLYAQLFGDEEDGFEPTEKEHVGNLQIHHCRLKKVWQSKSVKIRKCVAGEISPSVTSKTIILIGTTGSGKSTLIDGIANYMFNVNWDQNYRVKLVSLTEDEKEKARKGEKVALTDWITVYSIPPAEAIATRFTLNIVDTPGFTKDATGKERDQQLIEQIQMFFNNPEDHGIDKVDAICFVVPSPQALLTEQQKQIFNSILSMFGKDTADNIFIMATFADGDTPPVIGSFKAAGIPFKTYYPFNNSALFTATDDSSGGKLQQQFIRMFWDLGMESYKHFLTELGTIQPKSLTLPEESLRKREALTNSSGYLKKRIEKACLEHNNLSMEFEIVQHHRVDIQENGDKQYDILQASVVEGVDPDGIQSVNCINCHMICHVTCSNCTAVKGIESCCVMDQTGKCQVCPEKCNSMQHFYHGILHYVNKVNVCKTYQDLKNRYCIEESEYGEVDDVLHALENEIDGLKMQIQNYIKKAADCLQEIKKFSVKPEQVDVTAYVEMMIKDLRKTKMEGWDIIVSVLEKLQ